MEFPARVEGLFRLHYMVWSEQHKIEFSAPEYLRNVIRIITETGLENREWDSGGIDGNCYQSVPESTREFRGWVLSCFRVKRPGGYQKTFKTVWHATRLSAGGVADEFVTQLLRQGDARSSRSISQMKREAQSKLNRNSNESEWFWHS